MSFGSIEEIVWFTSRRRIRKWTLSEKVTEHSIQPDAPTAEGKILDVWKIVEVVE